MAFGGRSVSSKLRPEWGVGTTVGQYDDESMLVKWSDKNGEISIEYNEDLNWDVVQDGTSGARASSDDTSSSTTED
jgi:hypothetical protein